LCLWFHRTFKDEAFRSGPFVPPQAPVDESAELRTELAQLRQAVASFQAQQAQVSSELQTTKTQLSSISEERGIWEQLATESDKDKALLATQLAALQASAVAAPAAQFKQFVRSAATAASQVQLDEAETRRIIDEQLRQAGWEADTPKLRHSQGTRPQRGRNMAIAEWPCDGYLADYVLFHGLTPMAVVEAKRHNVDVSGALQQAKRYSRSFSASGSPRLITDAEQLKTINTSTAIWHMTGECSRKQLFIHVQCEFSSHQFRSNRCVASQLKQLGISQCY
jgi:type I restriction enzyme R subunit